MKIIDAKILDALHKFKIVAGSNRKVAKPLGFTGKHVGQILARKVAYFEDQTWERIEPVLRPYMDAPPTPEDKLAKWVGDNFSKLSAEEQNEVIRMIMAHEPDA